MIGRMLFLVFTGIDGVFATMLLYAGTVEDGADFISQIVRSPTFLCYSNKLQKLNLNMAPLFLFVLLTFCSSQRWLLI